MSRKLAVLACSFILWNFALCDIAMSMDNIYFAIDWLGQNGKEYSEVRTFVGATYE